VKPRRRPTLAQVASEVGVSVMTVSNAYNRPDQLSSALRERIMEAARRLGYPGPDPLGRGLRSGRARALGVLYDTWPAFVFQSPASVGFMQGLSGATGRAFMGLLLVPTPLPGEGNPLDTALADGFVVYSVSDADPQVPLALARRPTVIVDQPRLDGVPFVGIDDQSAAAGAAEHLLALGHRHIAVLSFALVRDGMEGLAGAGRQAQTEYAVTRARLSGYREALTGAGLDWNEVDVFECHFLQEADVAVRRLLARRPRPTAVLATSDTLALAVLRTAAEDGIRVPEELSVIGFDDTSRAQTTSPTLTTVRQPHIEKGRHAGELLLGLLRGDPTPPPVWLPTELIIRDSTGPPPRPSGAHSRRSHAP
jgi:DNA-binding LacI/PurR family transcriptional regulator